MKSSTSELCLVTRWLAWFHAHWTSEVNNNIYLPNKKIYLPWMIGWDFFQALKWLQFFVWTLYNSVSSLRWTVRAGPEGVLLRESWLYSLYCFLTFKILSITFYAHESCCIGRILFLIKLNNKLVLGFRE